MNFLKKTPLHWQIIVAMLLAVVAGCYDQATGGKLMPVFSFIGTLFLNALKMLIIPLIFSSIASGVASLGKVQGFGRMGGKTALYYVSTSFIAIVIGLTAVNLVKPGFVDGVPGKDLFSMSDATQGKLEAMGSRGLGDLVDVFLRMVPPNVIDAASSNSNMLAIIFFALIFGYFITRLKEDSLKNSLETFIRALNEVMMEITQWVMKFAPIGVFGLVAKALSVSGLGAFIQLGKFFFTVMGALLIHLLVVMPLLLRLVGNIDPFKHFKAMKEALITAFSTSSSSATLPVTMNCIQKAGVSKQTSSFVLPLGATINMDGTALFECVAVLFIAQAYGVDLSLASQIMVVALALLTSIGVAGIPSASLVAIVVILNNVGIPEEGIGLLFAVDRILDMSRTAVNVFSDSCGAVIIAKSEGEKQLYENI